MTPIMILEALDMLEPLFFFLEFEFFFVGTCVCKMSQFMAHEAHEII